MASVIRIKRSSTAGDPSVLAQGELAYSSLSGAGGDRLYIGVGAETGGNAAEHVVIGGKFFTDRLDHTAGVLTPNSAVVVDENNKINELNIGLLAFAGNAITSDDTNANIELIPNGTGSVVIGGQAFPRAFGTAGQFLQTDGTGQLSWQAVPSGQFTLAGDTGTDLFTTGETLTFSGAGAISTAVTDNTITVSVADASTTVKGVASFDATNFTVADGAVSITDGSIANAKLTNSSVTIGSTEVDLGGSTSSLSGLNLVSVTDAFGTVEVTGNKVSYLGTLDFSLYSATANINVNYANITNVATPVEASDAVNKAYADAIAAGVKPKASVKAATTGPITLSGAQTIDGVALVTGDRVLVKNQIDATQNGIYVVEGSGDWARAEDADNSPDGEVSTGIYTFVEAGTVNEHSSFILTTPGPITLGTTELSFSLYSIAGALAAGAGLSKSGDEFSVNVAAEGGIEISGDNLQLKSSVAGNGLSMTSGVINVGGTADRISVSADAIDIASTYVGQTSITTLGTVTTGTWSADTIAVTKGGTGLTTVATGDILFASAADTLSTLAIAAEGKVLQVSASGVPTWGDLDGGTY